MIRTTFLISLFYSPRLQTSSIQQQQQQQHQQQQQQQQQRQSLFEM